MPAIVVISDFSTTARSAANYACCLGQAYSLPVVLLHNYIVPIAVGDNTAPMMPVAPVFDAFEIADESMQMQLQTLKQAYPGIELSYKIVYGDFTDALNDYDAATGKPFLIVMGNDGDTSFLSASGLLPALRETTIPVLAVPENVTYKTLNKLCVALDPLQNSNEIPLQQIAEILARLKVQLHILVVTNTETEPKVDHSAFESMINEKLAAYVPVYHFLHHEHTDTAIASFIVGESMDWLGIAPHHRSLLNQLFHKSHTAEIVHTVKIPIIALH